MLFCRSFTARIRWSSCIAIALLTSRIESITHFVNSVDYSLCEFSQRQSIAIRIFEPADSGCSIWCGPDSVGVVLQFWKVLKPDTLFRELVHSRFDVWDLPSQTGEGHRRELLARLLDMKMSATDLVHDRPPGVLDQLEAEHFAVERFRSLWLSGPNECHHFVVAEHDRSSFPPRYLAF